LGTPHSTVHQVLRRGGSSRREPSERATVLRYERPCPGNLLHMDVKKLGKFTEPGHALTGDGTKRSRRVGWEYVHSIIDDCSRLAYSEIHDDEEAPTVTAFTRRALDWFLDRGIVAERLMTDNAFTYIHNKTLRELLYRRAISHIRHPALHAPHQRQGRALPADPATRVGLRPPIRLERRRRASLPHWIHHYNEQRTHSALGNHPPTAPVRNVTGHNS
jgi:transposase InsO family protein